MNEFLSPKPNQENLPIKVEVATLNDWEDCKNLRIEEISGKDSEMFGFFAKEDLEKEQNKNKEDWQRRLSQDNEFFVLSRVNSQAVGFGNAMKKDNNLWRIRWGFVKEKFRGHGIQKKIIILRLKEILKRGGKIVESGVVAKNEKSFKNLTEIGFKIADTHMIREEIYSYTMTVDLSDPEIIKNINNFVI
ncbi:MAG: GNAT family N-acetyltransferase [Patescibacteria group bacterium]